VVPSRGDNKHFHTRAQTKARDNEHHRALEGHLRHEEATDRLKATHMQEKERKVKLKPIQEQATQMIVHLKE
jgi:hypothetical protein